MKTTTELQLQKLALVLTIVVLLLAMWIVVSWLLISDPDPIVPAEASLRVDEIRFGVGLDELSPQGLVSRPLFWEGRQAYTPPETPAVFGTPGEQPRGSAVIDKAELLGVYSGGGISGIIVSHSGERRRLQKGQSIGDWTFSMYGSDAAVFERAGEKKVLHLQHAVPRSGVERKAVATNAAKRRGSREKGEAALDVAAGSTANPQMDATNDQNDKGE